MKIISYFLCTQHPLIQSKFLTFQIQYSKNLISESDQLYPNQCCTQFQQVDTEMFIAFDLEQYWIFDCKWVASVIHTCLWSAQFNCSSSHWGPFLSSWESKKHSKLIFICLWPDWLAHQSFWVIKYYAALRPLLPQRANQISLLLQLLEFQFDCINHLHHFQQPVACSVWFPSYPLIIIALKQTISFLSPCIWFKYSLIKF